MPPAAAGHGNACAAIQEAALCFSGSDRGAFDHPLAAGMMMKRKWAQKENTQSGSGGKVEILGVSD